MGQKRPRERNLQTGNRSLGRAPLCQGRPRPGSFPPRGPGGRGCAARGNVPLLCAGRAGAAACWLRAGASDEAAHLFLLPRSLRRDSVWQREPTQEGWGSISPRGQGLVASKMEKGSQRTFTWPYVRPPIVFPIVLIVKGISQV